ncbi:hypothetical protein CAC42_864 [Sphaceloma murrayae]|uniref:NmrA-like domain-containing protein n=1 Tax=Sphaceloma murrayae TaxID=2082308 RepID=A0A2K1QKA7_9PEZI|nr:hypothetical protein CAC42_864 [Sphaceloma murrayae]
MAKLLVVVGATGQQGRSIIQSVLEDPQLNKLYTIRGTTRNVDSNKAQALASKGIEIVQANVDDPESLRKAFSGADVVYANTVTIYDGRTREHEVEQGRALADAAVASKVPFYIWMTLPNCAKISAGKFEKNGHFDGKEEVEQYIRTLPIRSAFFSPGSFMSNFHDTTAPRPAGDGTYAWAGPARPETQLPLIDTAADTGKWITAILADFDRFEGKVFTCATKLYTLQEASEIMSNVSGKTIVYKQVPADVFKSFLPPTMADHVTEMLLYFQNYGYWGPGTEDKVAWSAAQARGKLTTLEEYLRARPLSLD